MQDGGMNSSGINSKGGCEAAAISPKTTALFCSPPQGSEMIGELCCIKPCQPQMFIG